MLLVTVFNIWLLSNENILFKELNLVDVKDIPDDFYNFLLHKLKTIFELHKDEDKNNIKGSYFRLYNFIWDRAYIKKAILTIPYNSSSRSVNDYIAKSLIPAFFDKDNDCYWYTDTETNTTVLINTFDINLLIKTLKEIIFNGFVKIKKLSKYLKNIAKLFFIINQSITWNLPSGLVVNQSYLETRYTTINPFIYSKSKLSISVTGKGVYSKNIQIRSLMPNLIHYLDASSLCLLYEQFSPDDFIPQFFSVQDCFDTICEKVNALKTILASVYTDLYSSEPYLNKFDRDIFEYISSKTVYEVVREDRSITIKVNT